MRRSRVQSSSVRSIGYDPRQHALEIEFHGGSIYRYGLVPESVFERLRTAPSVGSFVNTVVKPRYPARKLR
jgi:hypothetical protein